MVEPEDFGLPAIATLAHVGEPGRSPRHGGFWRAWEEGVWSSRPRLQERRQPDPSDPSASHEFESFGSVRIGCRLLAPEAPPRAGLVILHGYENVPTLAQEERDWLDLAARGLAVLIVRIRAYPGSQLDCQRLVEHCGPAAGGEWITWGLASGLSGHGPGCEWVLSLAVADVVNAARALRHELHALQRRREPGPIYLYGESFGAGLAVLASSALADRDPVQRLALALPTFGDWDWRLRQPEHLARGTGAAVGRFIDRNTRLDIPDLLRLHDAAVHARRIHCPVLCKLAMRDEVVPAPAAATVYNNLATPPGLKRRFVVRYGHFDGGIADARRHAAFAQLARDYLDPARDPFEVLNAPSATSGPR